MYLKFQLFNRSGKRKQTPKLLENRGPLLDLEATRSPVLSLLAPKKTLNGELQAHYTGLSDEYTP